MFHHAVLAGAPFHGAVCLGLTDKNCKRMKKLVKSVSAVLGRWLENVRSVARVVLKKLKAILSNNKHLPQNLLESLEERLQSWLLSSPSLTTPLSRIFQTRKARGLFLSSCSAFTGNLWNQYGMSFLFYGLVINPFMSEITHRNSMEHKGWCTARGKKYFEHLVSFKLSFLKIVN